MAQFVALLVGLPVAEKNVTVELGDADDDAVLEAVLEVADVAEELEEEDALLESEFTCKRRRPPPPPPKWGASSACAGAARLKKSNAKSIMAIPQGREWGRGGGGRPVRAGLALTHLSWPRRADGYSQIEGAAPLTHCAMAALNGARGRTPAWQ